MDEGFIKYNYYNQRNHKGSIRYYLRRQNMSTNIHCILLTSLLLNLDSHNSMRIYNTNSLFHNYCS